MQENINAKALHKEGTLKMEGGKKTTKQGTCSTLSHEVSKIITWNKQVRIQLCHSETSEKYEIVKAKRLLQNMKTKMSLHNSALTEPTESNFMPATIPTSKTQEKCRKYHHKET